MLLTKIAGTFTAITGCARYSNDLTTCLGCTNYIKFGADTNGVPNSITCIDTYTSTTSIYYDNIPIGYTKIVLDSS